MMMLNVSTELLRANVICGVRQLVSFLASQLSSGDFLFWIKLSFYTEFWFRFQFTVVLYWIFNRDAVDSGTLNSTIPYQ